MKCLVALLLLPLAAGSLFFSWIFTNTLHAESIHRFQAGLGDSRGLSLGEELKIGLIWVPWSILIVGWVLLYCIIRIRRRPRSKSDTIEEPLLCKQPL
jgi:hypothetical protein